MYWLKIFLQVVVLPPTSLVLMAAAGAFLWGRRTGRYLVGIALVLYLVLAMPVTGNLLMSGLSQPPVLDDEDLARAEVIVLLTAGMYSNAPEYGAADTVNGSTLFRARYAVWLHRRSGLPILVVGGRVVPSESTEAAAAAHVLREEFRVPVRWQVGRGRDTIESAAAARDVLGPSGIRVIALVTSAVHMPRAVAVFRGEGFEVLPAPTGLRVGIPLGVRAFLPSATGMSQSSYAIKEWLGVVWTMLLD